MTYEKKTAVLLINLGTPDKPKLGKVRKYLIEFLNDPRVIDIPWLPRKLLVNGIIIPFRVRNSTKLYRLLWTEKGSPLLYYSESLKSKLQSKVNVDTNVFLAMRYGSPSIKSVLRDIKKTIYDEIIMVALYPQYASSTSGTVTEEVMKEIKTWNVIPNLRFINQFYDNPLFIDAFADLIAKHNPKEYDHVIFSYHGLPIRHVKKVHPNADPEQCTCYKRLPKHGQYCYRGTSYETTRLLAQKLGLTPDEYTVSFQSRISNKWLTPFTDEVIMEKATQGCKKILIAAPSFVSDCLETNIELGVEYKELFIEKGGETLQMVESLNDSDKWVDALANIIGQSKIE